MRWFVAVLFLVAIAPLCALADPITMAWSPVGNAGNAADSRTGHGAVGYNYSIGTYDVTNSQYQYVEFLNAKATGQTPSVCTTAI